MFLPMEQNQREQIIRKFVDHAMAAWNDDNTSHPDMKQVARGLGMSEEEIAEVVRVGEIYFEQGAAHRRADRLDEAIEQLTVAVAIDPSNVERLEELATAYGRRYVRDRSKADRKEAGRLVKRIRVLDPGRDAINAIVQSAVNGSADDDEDAGQEAPAATVSGKSLKPVPDATKRKVRVMVIVGVVNALITGGIFFFLSSSKHPARIVERNVRAIPVVQSIDAGASPFAIHVDESALDRDEGIYRVRGSVISTQPGASTAGVTLHLTAVDSSGREALTTPIPLRPCDDALCFDYTGPFILRLANISLNVKEGEKRP